MYWINVDEKYLDYLRNFEKRIPKTEYGSNAYKPFFGVLFKRGELLYITQISHPQSRHYKLKQQKDFYKIYDPKNPNRIIAVINLNYMFPIHKSYVHKFQKKDITQYRAFSSNEEASKYLNLLSIELKAINSLDIGNSAKELYKLKYSNPKHIISKRCVDFKQLEKYAINYYNQGTTI